MTSLIFLWFRKDKLETPYVVSYFFNLVVTAPTQNFWPVPTGWGWWNSPVKKSAGLKRGRHLEPIKPYNYGFSNRKKPTPLDGSMGLVMNVESVALILYKVGVVPLVPVN